MLRKTVLRTERLGSLFADYRVVMYENDSSDRTLQLLERWQAENSRVTVLTENLGDPVHPGTTCLRRAERMAHYRRQYWQFISAQLADFDQVIVIDTDLDGGWSCDGIANTYGQAEWDFVGSNGILYKRRMLDVNHTIQYDAWAFRRAHSLTPLSTREVNFMKWQRGEPLVPVRSCFGGLGVYQMPAFLAGKYAGGDCEHIPFHATMRQQGFGNAFLNPSQITLYGRRQRRLDPLVRWTLSLAPGLLPGDAANWL